MTRLYESVGFVGAEDVHIDRLLGGLRDDAKLVYRPERDGYMIARPKDGTDNREYDTDMFEAVGRVLTRDAYAGSIAWALTDGHIAVETHGSQIDIAVEREELERVDE